MDMIEKVARVIAEKVGAVSSSTFCDIATTDDLRDAQLDIGRVDLMAAARDVISAMREPSEGMLDAGILDSVIRLDDTGVREIWQAMIDAAIAEATPPTPQS